MEQRVNHLDRAREGLASASPRCIPSEGASDPLIWGLANTLCQSDKSVAGVLEGSDGLGNHDLSRVLVDLVVEGEDGAGVGGDLVIVVLHDSGCVVLPVVGVKVPQRDGLSSHSSNLLNLVVVVSVGRTNKCRICTSDLHDGLFDEPELVVELVPVQGVEVLVRPSVRGDLMTLVIGVFDAGSLIFVVNTTGLTTPVVAIEEESALASSGGQSIGDFVQVPPRTVIEGKSCGARDSARGDNFARGALEKLLEGVSIVVAWDGSAINGSGGESANGED